MSKKKATVMSKKNVQTTHPNTLSWEAAIAEAERQILLYRERITKLKASIRFFKEKIESGEPFPRQPKGKKKEAAK